MSPTENNNLILWKESVAMWGMLALALLLLIFISYDGLSFMVGTWERREEYSHGYLIPLITLFLIWQKSDFLSRRTFDGSWWGVTLLVFGIIITLFGILGAVSTLIQYGFLIGIIGIALSLMGFSTIKLIIIPLLILSFMIPLPGFILFGLSSELQLISSKIGVAVIRMFDISVYLEGNVIDLGTYKLQVVEACSGLNYLFPLMSLSFVAAYFYNTSLWKRAVIFVSSVPVTILMNSFRIGVIGVLVEHWGQSQAEGFLHDFEGWVIFMACMGILFIEMWLLNKIGKDSKPLREVFGLEFPALPPENAEIHYRKSPNQFIAALLVLVITSAGVFALDKNEVFIPERKDFVEFPMNIESWKGNKGFLEQIYLDALKLDDYIIADYENDESKSVNFYVAYYKSQQAGEAAHSPRTCIPGGGWRINELNQKIVEDVQVGGKPMMVNRLQIQKGEYKQIVYYWFKVKDRVITSEYMLKLHLIWDAVTTNRTDMALVRFTTVSKPGEDVEEADKRIQSLLKGVMPILSEYVPE